MTNLTFKNDSVTFLGRYFLVSFWER